MDAQKTQELRNHFQTEVRGVEPEAEWWNRAVARATEQSVPIRWGIAVRRSRLAWILIPLAVLLLAGIAYASSSVIRERFASLFPQVERSGLAQEVDLRQTVDGVTVRVERAYADSNQVLVGYTVSGPPTTATGPGARYLSNVGGLAVAGGPVLPAIGVLGTVPGSTDVLGDWNPSDRLAVVALFEASVIQGAPSELGVTLNIKVYDRVPFPESQATLRTFTFDFKVKFHPAKVVSVGQTLDAAGVPVSIERLGISHLATRVVFRFDPPYDDREYAPAVHSFLLPAGSSPIEGAGIFNGDFTKNTGEWTVTISELIFLRGLPPGVDLGVPENENGQIRPQGPWVVRFQVP